MENIEVACFMLQERGLNRGSHITSSEAGDAAFQTGSHDGIIPSGIADCFFLFKLLFMIYSINFMYLE